MEEIPNLVIETGNLTKDPSAESIVIDKCLRLLGQNQKPQVNDIGFCFLAKIIPNLSPQSVRAYQSRFTNRLPQIAQSTTFPSCLYARELLIRNPQGGEIQSAACMKIIVNSIDMAVQSDNKTMKSLAAELFSLRSNDIILSELLATLMTLLNASSVKTTTKDMLPLKTFGIASLRDELILILFECLALALSSIRKEGISITRSDIIRVIEAGIHNDVSRSAAFMCLRSLCANCKYSIIPLLPRIVSTLISDLQNPDIYLIQTLAFISMTFGPLTSTLHKHLYVLFTALPKLLHKTEYAEFAASLFSDIIEKAGSIIKIEVLNTIQKSICDSALRYTNSSVYQKILAAFLSLSNENLPIPLNVARVVVSRCTIKSAEATLLRNLCDVSSRPRVVDVALVKQKKLIDMSHRAEVSENFQAANHEDKDDLNKTQNEEDDDIEIIKDVHRPDTPEPEPPKRQRKMTEESKAPEPSPPVKKKKNETDMKTQLLDGEASVDDILDLFDPS